MAELLFVNLVPVNEREAFVNKLKEVANALKVDPNWLLQVMQAESGLSPNKANYQLDKDGKGKHIVAVGLIQFTKSTAEGLGTTHAALMQMSRLQQLPFVQKYFQPYAGRMRSYYDMYAATFFPAAIGKPDDWVLQSKNLNATIIAKQNARIDRNKDGQITVAEFKQYVIGSVSPRFQNIIFGGDRRVSTPDETSIPSETIYVQNLEPIVFRTDETYVNYPSTVPVAQQGGNNPKEFAYSKASSEIASKSISENYSDADSKELHQNLSASLNPQIGPFANVTIPFLIIRSYDFFKQKITVLPQLSSFVKGMFSTKTKTLDFVANNILAPQIERIVPVSTNTSMTVDDIHKELRAMHITDPEILNISDRVLLIEKIKENGLIIFDKENPLAEIAQLIKEENDTIEEFATLFTPDIDFCPDGVILPAKYQGSEVSKVAEQCCEPIEEAEISLDVPILEEPELLSETEILDFVDNIDNISNILSTCSNKKSEAVSQIQKIIKIREDLYPLKFFMKKRMDYIKDFKSGKIIGFKIFTPADLIAIAKNPSFSVSSFLTNGILHPTNDHYTNQSGLLTKPNEEYFLILSEKGKFYDELYTLFEMYNPKGSLSNFIQNSETLPKKLKDTQPPKGILYDKFYDKFNSAERVDFLFTSLEQGYLTQKPTAAELLTPQGEEMIKHLKIDEEKARNFLRTYHTEEKIRSEEKLKELKKNDYFSSLDSYAKEQASTVFGLFRVLTPIGKLAIEKMEKENLAIQSFDDELSLKITALELICEQADLCINEQITAIEDTIPSPPIENIPPPGTDPFGALPPNPLLPGSAKNKYWKEYTKALQTVSFMPIPDVKFLTKRLFRYYPVGLQIDVPVPPKVLPTLASGIPDMKISIPFPIIWKHLTTLSTPAGQFVLWLTYCAPYTFSLYLMYIDENLNTVFLSSAKGKVEIPAKSLKWDDDSLLAKSVIERIPALKIPMSSLPPVDSLNNNNTPDDKNGAIQELQTRIKSKIDNIDSGNTQTKQRIEDRTKLRKYREKLRKTLNVDTGQIDVSTIQEMLKDVQEMVSRKALDMLKFEPFSVPKTQKKAMGSPTLLEFKNAISKVKSLKNSGALVESKTINIEKIFTEKSLSILDTPFGKKVSKELDDEMTTLNTKMRKERIFDKNKIAEERCKVLAKKVGDILAKGASKITNKALGYVEVPINLIPSFLPEPARSSIAIEPMPVWMPIVTAATKAAASELISATVQDNFIDKITSQINLGERLPQGRDLLSLGVITGVNTVLESANIKKLVPITGWPREISYPSVNMMKQALKDAKNAIWKIKIRPPGGGIPQINITPEIVKKSVSPFLNASINLIFANILQRFSLSEQNANASINLQQSLQFSKAIFGNDIWDLNEDDIKQLATGFVRDSLLQANSAISKILDPIDKAEKTFNSILKKLAPFSKQKTEKKDEPTLDIGGAVALSLFKSFIAKYVSGEKVSPPFPVVLLGCMTGLPGWTIFTQVNPFAAIDKVPAYERVSLKNVPFVIFLDMIAATAQRYGGIGSNYVTPYFVPDA